MKAMDQQSIVNAVRSAGVVGAGGGGFPTHVKLGARVDTVIANGSECEPLLATDKTEMSARPDLLIDGLTYAMKATGASKGIIAVKAHYNDVVESLRTALPKDNSIGLRLLDNYYPAGDEFLLVQDATGRSIPEGGIPLDVQVVVNNVVTLMEIAMAMRGMPVTSRSVTVTGAVASPSVIRIPIGTPYEDLINIAGGFTVRDAVIIDGGPMMGKIVRDMRAGIAKTTSGIVALPREHFVVAMKQRTIDQELKLSRAACCQCYRCSDLCPRNLLGHELYPHMTMRTVNYVTSEPTSHVTSAFLCSQCGICEMVACDIMRLSPRRIYASLREKMVSAGFKNPHGRKGVAATEPYSYRKLPMPQLLRKIDLVRFDKKPIAKGEHKVGTVRIPLHRHTGAPARATVARGDAVKLGDVIGEIPADKLGARYHASISGRVTAVDSDHVEIAS